jgi:hypothetical protein
MAIKYLNIKIDKGTDATTVSFTCSCDLMEEAIKIFNAVSDATKEEKKEEKG